MNPKSLIPLIAGLGIAGLAAKLGFDVLRKANAGQTKVVSLWAPVEDIPRGVHVTKEMLAAIEFPAKFAPKGSIVEPEKIIGRVPHTGCPAGLPVLDSMLLPMGQSAGLNPPPGFRAVAVKVDESSGVDSHLQPGAFVDVIGMFNERVGGKNQTIARIILENVEVAAVGARIAPDGPEDEAAEKGSRSKSKPARAVTLYVRQGDMARLHLAEQKGKIKLGMRGVDDNSAGENNEVTDLTDLLPEIVEDEPASDEPGFLDTVAGWFESKTPPEPAPAALPEPEPVVTAPPPPPPPAHVMRIFNGDDVRVLAWSSLTSMEPHVLSGEGPNIFNPQTQPPANLPFLPPTSPLQPPISQPPQSQTRPMESADETSEEDDGSKSSEPEELFE